MRCGTGADPVSRGTRWTVLGCLTAELVAVSCWVGGLVVLVAAVIPAVFNTFGGQDAGGLFLTRAFEGYNRVVIGSAAVLLGSALWRHRIAARGWPSVRATRLEWILLIAMVGVAGVLILVLHPEAAARQAEAFAIKDGAARKAALETFFKVHQPTRVLYMINLVLGVALLGAKVRPWLTRFEGTT